MRGFMSQRIAQAVIWAIGSAVTFSAGSAATKFLGQKLPIAELAFFRAAFGAVVLFGVWRLIADLGKARDPWGYALRCGLGVVALYGLMYAFTTIPLALASLLFFTRVLLMPVAGRVMLGERSGPDVWLAVAVGFVGASVSVWPALSLPEWQFGVGAALIGALASAGSQTAVRRLTATNDPALVVLIFAAVSGVATFPLAAANWVAPPVTDWPVLAGLGLFTLGAQYAAARAYKLAPVGFLAPFDFLTIPLAAVLGYLLFAEVPSTWTAAGSVLVIASGAWVAWRGAQAG